MKLLGYILMVYILTSRTIPNAGHISASRSRGQKKLEDKIESNFI